MSRVKELHDCAPATVNSIRYSYFCWLYDLVFMDRNHFLLLGFLHDLKFTWTVDRDKNRARDGMDLRDQFMNEFMFFEDDVRAALCGPCTVLEMLVALCIRCENDIMYDPEFGDRTAIWFWDILHNLGLGDMDDESINYDFVRQKVDIFLERRFKKDGEGSPFPGVELDDSEVKNTEFWAMMQSYLLMKYGGFSGV